MSISIDILITVVIAAITIAGFIITRMKEAEARGRMMQRIDELEKSVAEVKARASGADEKINSHDSELVKITTEIESIRDLIERMDKKLDQALARNC